MKKSVIAVIAAICCMIMTSSTPGAPDSHKCPLCTSTMYWTGQTKTEWGKLTYEMKCASGHVSWEVGSNQDSSTPRKNKDEVKCQYDGFTMYFTGKTKTEWGKLLKEYKCPSGHTVWVTE